MPYRHVIFQCTCGNSFDLIREILFRMPGGTVTCEGLKKDKTRCKRTVPVVDIIKATEDISVMVFDVPPEVSPEDTQEKML